MRRRTFVRAMATSAAWMAAPATWPLAPAHAATLPTAAIPKRTLGKTGLDLSVIGFGGIVARDNTPDDVDRAVGQSRDLGINYFDTAASYGNAEVMMAPVIKPIRQEIVLATKTRERTRDGAAAEFARSCEILGTDYFDMFLVHGIQHVDKDVEPAFAADGAMSFLLEKKKEGQIRNLGFSAHSTEAALLAMDRYDFDFFYFPISYVSFYKGNFGPAVLDVAKQKGIPCVALKAMARQHWPEGTPQDERPPKCWYQPIQDAEEASLALRWALSQGVTSILPPGNETYYRQTLAVSENLDPITPEETERLKALAEGQRPLFPRI